MVFYQNFCPTSIFVTTTYCFFHVCYDDFLFRVFQSISQSGIPHVSPSCAETNIQHTRNYDCKLRILRTRGEKKIGEKIDIFFKLMFVADIIVSILDSTCLFHLSVEK